MIPQDVLQKVFFLKKGDGVGTCFLVSIENRDYLVTAKHIFPDCAHNEKVNFEIFHETGWNRFEAVAKCHKNQIIDIVVLDIDKSDVKNQSFTLGNRNCSISQDCFFLGFPFGRKMDDSDAFAANNGFPLPFVKKAVVSSMVTDTSGATQIFLDGHNNPGFSGGPVVIVDLVESNVSKENKMRIVGVISAYVVDPKEIRTPFGDLVIRENSGIVISYSFEHVFEILGVKV